MDLSQFSLDGKVALVTGASRGIGKATAIGFARAGADVIVTSRKLPDLEMVADEIKALGRKSMAIATHVGRMDQIDALVKQAAEEFGRIDILVNNAGTSPVMDSVLDIEERAWDVVMNLNLKGLFFLSQAVARMMKEQGGGQIINVASVDAFKPEYLVSAYSISKAAVVMVTRAMARELAQYNIRVNCIAPGAVSTKLLDSHWFNIPEEEAKAQKETMAKRIPVGHIAEPEEMANIAIFLASESSSYVTGQTIIAEGGSLLL